MRQKVTNGTTRGPHRCCPDSHCPRHTSSGLEYSDYSYRQILQAGTEEEVRRKGLLARKKKRAIFSNFKAILQSSEFIKNNIYTSGHLKHRIPTFTGLVVSI